jgi:hypothetical protein
MKNPSEYLENQVFEARRPRKDLQPVVAYTDAVQAIEKALADAEKYKYLLMRALRRHADDLAAPAVVPEGSVPEATVVRMYTADAEPAA